MSLTEPGICQGASSVLIVLLVSPHRPELAQEPLMVSLSDAKVNEIKMDPFSFVRGKLF